MKSNSVAAIYISFFAMIAFAIFYTSSLYPLFALLATPSYSRSNDDQRNEKLTEEK